MSHSFFVTGTDTEVGKTVTACALLAAAAARGLTTAAVKPVAAGCDEDGRNEDALALLAAMTADMPYEQVNPVALQAAIAPHIAAQEEGARLSAGHLAGICRGVMCGAQDFVLVEGAGGWRVPLGPRETLADLARELNVGVILVVGMRLGCINHALLTAEAVARDGLSLVGWVANQPGERMGRHEENLATLRQLLGAPCLGELPYSPGAGPADLAVHLDIEPLLGA
ncbi:MAG: dethiobiotin synthase [Halioglobus sp.]|nr:dethiobiotin synthase [Halioglobus sp.]